MMFFAEKLLITKSRKSFLFFFSLLPCEMTWQLWKLIISHKSDDSVETYRLMSILTFESYHVNDNSTNSLFINLQFLMV